MSRARGNGRRHNSNTALVAQSRNTSAHAQHKPRPLAHGARGCSSFAPEHDRSLGATLRTNSAPWTATSTCTSTALMLQFGKQRASMGSNQTANTCTIEVRRVETKAGIHGFPAPRAHRLCPCAYDFLHCGGQSVRGHTRTVCCSQGPSQRPLWIRTTCDRATSKAMSLSAARMIAMR